VHPVQTQFGGHRLLAGEPSEPDQCVCQLRVDRTGGTQAHRHGALPTHVEGAPSRRNAEGRVRVRVFPDAAHRGVPAGVRRVAREVGRRRVGSAQRAPTGQVASSRALVAVELRAADQGRGGGPLSAGRRPSRLLRRAVRPVRHQQAPDGPIAIQQSGAGSRPPDRRQG